MLLLRIVLLIVIFGNFSIISGCGWLWGEKGYIRNRDNEYRQSQTTPRMQVPEQYDQSAIQDVMPIPEVSGNPLPANEKFVVPPPRSLLTANDSDGISIQGTGNKRWILVDAPKNQVWPTVKSFFDTYQVPLAREDASFGELETKWIALDVLDESLGGRLKGRVLGREQNGNAVDKFKVNLQHGVQRGSTEIHLVQTSAPEGTAPNKIKWPTYSENLSLEGAVLNELLVHVAREAQGNTSTTFLSQETQLSEDRAKLIADGNGNPILRLNLDFDRAWGGVRQALEDAQFTILETDENFDIFYIEYIVDETGSVQMEDKNKEPSFFEKLVGSDDKASKAPKNQLAIKLSSTNDGVDVTVQIDSDTSASPEIAEQILSTIKDYLI